MNATPRSILARMEEHWSVSAPTSINGLERKISKMTRFSGYSHIRYGVVLVCMRACVCAAASDPWWAATPRHCGMDAAEHTFGCTSTFDPVNERYGVLRQSQLDVEPA